MLSINFSNIIESFQKWYGGNENDFHFNLGNGLLLGLILDSFIYKYKIYNWIKKRKNDKKYDNVNYKISNGNDN